MGNENKLDYANLICSYKFYHLEQRKNVNKNKRLSTPCWMYTLPHAKTKKKNSFGVDIFANIVSWKKKENVSSLKETKSISTVLA